MGRAVAVASAFTDDEESDDEDEEEEGEGRAGAETGARGDKDEAGGRHPTGEATSDDNGEGGGAPGADQDQELVPGQHIKANDLVAREGSGGGNITAGGLSLALGLPATNANVSPPIRTEVYYFYQAEDGQPVVLHAACVRVLLAHYGAYENLPLTLEAPVVELEQHTQDDDTRRRSAHLRHLPLTTTYTLAELDLEGLVPSEVGPRNPPPPFSSPLLPGCNSDPPRCVRLQWWPRPKTSNPTHVGDCRSQCPASYYAQWRPTHSPQISTSTSQRASLVILAVLWCRRSRNTARSCGRARRRGGERRRRSSARRRRRWQRKPHLGGARGCFRRVSEAPCPLSGGHTTDK